jgi:excisionase family DNA binding protein
MRHPHRPTQAAPPSSPAPAPILQAATDQRPPPMLVSIKEARRLIGVGHTRIYELINAGALETIRIGKRRMVRYSSLQKFSDISPNAQ